MPALHVRVHVPAASASFSMWPQRRPLHAASLTDAHRYQIAAMDALLGYGTDKSQSWQRCCGSMTWRLATALVSKLSVTVTEASLELHCSEACMLQQPESLDLQPDTAGSKTLMLSLESLRVAPQASLHLTLSKASPCAADAHASASRPLCALQLSGLSLSCCEQSPEQPAKVMPLVRRWSAEAACHQLPVRAHSRESHAQRELRVHVHAQAVVATVDALAVRALRLFVSATGEHARFARYRRCRPASAVRRDIRAWWRHAAHCVTMHLREIRQDAPLPILCLQHLPTFRRAYKARGRQTAAGARHGSYSNCCEQTCV